MDTLALDHTTSGIRIKSNVQGCGEVRSVMYRHVRIKDSIKHSPVPISITPFYTGQTADDIAETGITGLVTRDYKGITIEDVHSVTPGVVQVTGLNPQHMTEVHFDGVSVDGMQPSQVKARNVTATVG